MTSITATTNTSSSSANPIQINLINEVRALDVSITASTSIGKETRVASGNKLEEAYLEARNSGNLKLIGSVLLKYGRLQYENDYSTCMALQRGALNAYFVLFGLYGHLCFDHKESLAELSNELKRHRNFSAFDAYFLSSDMDAVAEQIEADSETLFEIGYALSWYTNGLANSKGFERDADILGANNLRFTKAFELAEKLLKKADSDKANNELAELLYNGISRQALHEGDIQKAHQILDQAAEINPSLEMKARISNLKSCDFAAKGDAKKAGEWLEKAIEIRESFPIENQDPFLVANIWCRRSGLYQKSGDMQGAESALQKALDHAEACRSERDVNDKLLSHENNHQYFGYYDMQMAVVKTLLDKKQEALKHIERALETFYHHEQSSLDLIEKANQIKEKLVNA